MYPLPVVLVGIDNDLIPQLRRELSHVEAEVESEFASIIAAIECLRQFKAKPRLVLVQIGSDCQAAKIERLSTTLLGWPVMALIPGDNALDSFLEANRAGAAQVVALPLDRLDFQRALNVIGSQFGRGLLDRRVFAVTGASGGSGATTLALNLATEIADQVRRSTILAEFTLQMGALASLFDVTPRVTIAHLIQEIRRVDDLLVEKTLIPVGDRLKILAGPDKMHALPSLEPGDLVKIVDCLKKLAEVTVLDMPGTFHATEFEVLNACDQVILVGLQSVPSIRALKIFRETLPEERVTHALWVVINRYTPGLKGLSATEIKQMLDVPRLLTVSNDYQSVMLAANQGRPLRRVVPSSPILRDLDGLIREILGLDTIEPKRFYRGLIGRVVRNVIG